MYRNDFIHIDFQENKNWLKKKKKKKKKKVGTYSIYIDSMFVAF